MDIPTSPTVVAAFAAVTATDATRPLLTYYDDATGERTELSAATLTNWVNKTANMLVDGLGLGPGDVAAVALPAHWQTAAVLLGAWSAGLAVDLVVPVQGPPDAVRAVAFAAADRLAQVRADETYALALDPFGLGFRSGPPPGALDFSQQVRGYGDHFTPVVPVTAASRAMAGGSTHGDLVAACEPIERGARLLIDVDATPNPADWLVAPLLAGASVVLCRNLDPARLADRLAAEHATPGGS